MRLKRICCTLLLVIIGSFIVISCTGKQETKNNMETKYEKGTFGYDVDYLSEKDTGLIVLKSDDERAQLILSAKYQAKVFTSTANGSEETVTGS